MTSLPPLVILTDDARYHLHQLVAHTRGYALWIPLPFVDELLVAGFAVLVTPRVTPRVITLRNGHSSRNVQATERGCALLVKPLRAVFPL